MVRKSCFWSNLHHPILQGMRILEIFVVLMKCLFLPQAHMYIGFRNRLIVLTKRKQRKEYILVEFMCCYLLMKCLLAYVVIIGVAVISNFYF